MKKFLTLTLITGSLIISACNSSKKTEEQNLDSLQNAQAVSLLNAATQDTTATTDSSHTKANDTTVVKH